MLRNEKLDLTKAINTYRAAEAERNKPKSLIKQENANSAQSHTSGEPEIALHTAKTVANAEGKTTLHVQQPSTETSRDV